VAEPGGTVRELARLVVAALACDMTTSLHAAGRVAGRLGIGDDDDAGAAEAALRRALGLEATCGACRNSPATHLVVADLGARPVRAEQLTCKPCADSALRRAGTGDRLRLYPLVPGEEDSRG
jgi:hypothetical protein